MYNESTNDYGIVLVSGDEYRCYILSICGIHKEFKLLNSDTQHLQKKQKKGGQSAPRFQRIRDEKYNRYINKVSEIIVETYMKNNHTNCLVEGLILAGPGHEKNNIFDHDLVQQYFKNNILRIIDTPEINDNTIHLVYKNCIDVIASDIDKYEIKICQNIKNFMTSNNNLYYNNEVIDAITEYKIKQVIYSPKLRDELKNKINEKLYDYELIEIKNNYHELPCELIGIAYY